MTWFVPKMLGELLQPYLVRTLCSLFFPKPEQGLLLKTRNTSCLFSKPNSQKADWLCIKTLSTWHWIMASMRLAKAISVSGFSKHNFLTNGIKIQILQCAQEREIRTQGYLALEYLLWGGVGSENGYKRTNKWKATTCWIRIIKRRGREARWKLPQMRLY